MLNSRVCLLAQAARRRLACSQPRSTLRLDRVGGSGSVPLLLAMVWTATSGYLCSSIVRLLRYAREKSFALVTGGSFTRHVIINYLLNDGASKIGATLVAFDVTAAPRHDVGTEGVSSRVFRGGETRREVGS